MPSDQPTDEQLGRVRTRLLQALTLALADERIVYESASVNARVYLPRPAIELNIEHKPNRG